MKFEIAVWFYLGFKFYLYPKLYIFYIFYLNLYIFFLLDASSRYLGFPKFTIFFAILFLILSLFVFFIIIII